jgi:hypothetical protein
MAVGNLNDGTRSSESIDRWNCIKVEDVGGGGKKLQLSESAV